VEYIFKHAVTQEVVYETLLVQRRKELHRRIGQAIEALYAGRLEEQAAILAYHYTRGDHRDKTVEYTVLAGDRAGRLYANADARSYYQQALTVVRAHPAPAGGDPAEIDIAVKLAGVGITRPDIEQDLANLERARGLAEALDDAPRLARVLYWLGRLHYMLGASHEAAIKYATRSLEIADRLGDESLAAPSVNLIGRVYWNQTDFVRASQMLERSVGQMTRLGNKTEAATAAGGAGFAFGCMGEFERALHYADRGVELAREARDPSAEAAAWQNRAFILEHRGDLTRALGEYAEARRIAEQVGDRFRLYIINVLEIRAHVLAGDPRRGRAVCEAAQAFAEQIRTKFLLSSLKMNLAACLLSLGQAAGALEPCREAIELAEQAGEKFTRALAGRVLAEVSVSLDPSPAGVRTGVAALEESIEMLRDIGARPEQARCYVVLARLMRLQGDADRAGELLARARALFESMDLQWDLNRLDEASR
jgi:tetratricopeptide (TPR) repeat protein